MNRYYIKATGSTCYDKSGLTYPNKLTIDLEQLVKLGDASEVHWEPHLNLDNLPEVLCFGYWVTEDQYDTMTMVSDIIYPMGLIIASHWDHVDQNEPW